MRPFVYDYQNYRAYLKDLIKWWGGQDRKYSLRWISKRLGFSSPAMLSMSLAGQRTLSAEKLSLLIEILKVLPDEGEYLRLIYDIDGCEDDRERERLETLKKTRYEGGLFQDLGPEAFEVYGKWFLPAIRELVAVANFKPDPFWIASQLGITPIEARDGLITLIRIGMVTINGKQYERSSPSLQPKSPPALVMDYTKTHIERSQKALSLERKHRYANSLTLAVSKATFARIPDILARLIAEVDMLAETDPERDDVAQLNVQFYSMTELARLKT